jgi:hypothetical protein
MEFDDIFAHGLDDLGKTHVVDYKINTKASAPFKKRPRRHSFKD